MSKKADGIDCLHWIYDPMTEESGNSKRPPVQSGPYAPAQVRKVIHVDMDAFYASVEQRDEPELRGKPVAVGGSRERGVVAAASYEARRFGIHSAMPSITAQRQCPDLIFIKPRFEVYRQVSLQIRAIFAEYASLVEPLSLDEAYLDVTENLKGIEYASMVAREIRSRIWEETNLTASAGISVNKFLSKMASGQNKPNGQFVITPDRALDFVEGLPVEKFHGIGRKTAEKMNRLGIFTGRDLSAKSIEFLKGQFGKMGVYYHGISRGVDNRPVQPHRIRKSVGAENTFAHDLSERKEMKEALLPIICKVWDYSGQAGVHGRTVTLKVKYQDFQQITGSRTTHEQIRSKDCIVRITEELLEGLFPMPKAVRLLGVTLSALNIETDDEQGIDHLQLSLGI